MTVSNTVAATVAAVLGAAVAAPAPSPANLWSIIVLGIPLSVLAAALAGSAIRYFREPADPDVKIPKKVFDTVADGFIGGWLAMLLLGLPVTRGYLGAIVAPEVIGAVCALLVHFVRVNGKNYLDQAFQTALSWFKRKPAPGGEP